MRERQIVRGVALVLLFAGLNVASAAEIKIFSAEAFKPAMVDLVSNFERASNHRVTAVFATGGVIEGRIRSGEAVDLTILPKPTFDPLVRDGKLAEAHQVAQSLLAVAVKSGAPKPDISSPDALKRTLLAAKSIGYSDPARGGGIGRQATQVIERLGIAGDLKSKTTMTPAGEFRELLATGKVELAFVFPIVVVDDPRIAVVGFVPAELQNLADMTFLAGVNTSAKESTAANAFIQYLLSPAAAQVIRAKGMTPANP
jgi:molybdate transport system substrate-binding protein